MKFLINIFRLLLLTAILTEAQQSTSNYFGFQKQKLNQTKTIQYHIDQSIKQIANHDIKTACGGRTDTGVHACNQVIHFDTSSKRSDFNWLKGMFFSRYA